MKRTMIGCIAGRPVDLRTVLLVHFDGANAATTFVDSSVYGKALTARGDAKLTTANKKSGTAAGTFDGTGDAVNAGTSADFAFGTGDFTVEAWIFVASWTSDTVIFKVEAASGLQFGREGTTNNWGVAENGIAWKVKATSLPSTGSWHHVAVARSGTTTKIFLNGTQVASGTDTTNYAQSGVTIGGGSFNGQIDELRVSKGVAWYTSNFAAPAEAFLT